MLWTLFGRFHPATVHFPIAMLSGAALMEFLQIVRRKPDLSPATLTMTIIGLASSVLASLMGWINASAKNPSGAIELHRWAGVATVAAAILAMVFVLRARDAQAWKIHAARASLFFCLIVVSLAGHWGGVLVYGDDYYWPTRNKEPLPIPAAGKVDFVADIEPIIRNSCFVCHGGEKSGKNGKGGLKLTTKALATRGGDNGACIVPRKPEDSTFYTLLVHTDPDVRMPAKAKQLPKEQIEKVYNWILQGAEWPEGRELK
jgi:uncharacterized membrane protein